jgi:predicted metal-dependent peptidase
MTSAEERIDKAIDWVFKERPWYSLIVDDWKIQEFPENPIAEMLGLTATAATDGPNLYFNRKFIEDLPTQDDINVLIEHEAGHIFLSHHFRLFKEGEKVEVTPAKNVAADLALNWFIREDFPPNGALRKIVCMPGDPKKDKPGALDFSQLPTGQTAEYYYKNMPEDMKKKLDGSSMQEFIKSLEDMIKNGGGTIIGGIMPHPSSKGSKRDQEIAKQKLENQIIGGVMAAGKDPKKIKEEAEKGQQPGGLKAGDMPGFIKEVVKEIVQKDKGPDWTHILRRFHHKNTKVKFSYARPNRRSSYRNDMMLPARFARESSEGLFLVDTSGSMSVEEMNRAMRESEKVLVAYPNSKITLRQADTQLQKTEQHFTRWDFPIKVPQTWAGRGGTELAGPIAEAAKSGRFAWMVVVTDMEWGYHQAKDPGIPTIWLQTKRLHADVPFGYPVDMTK